MILKRVYYRESLALLRPVHRVTVILLQMWGFVILTRSPKTIWGTQSPFTFFTSALWLCYTIGKVCHQRSNTTYVESKLVWPHAAYACMFYHVRHNNVASHCYLGSQKHDCWDNLAEWSKAPDLGSGPKGRGFKSHSCHDHTFSNVRPKFRRVV